jgi:hypothetical protein
MHRRVPRPIVWLLTAAWAGVIFTFSAIPGSSLPGGFSVQGHIGVYFILGALLTWALADDEARLSTVALAILLASLYGVSDEFHQHFVPMRNPDVVDWVTDTVGAAAGAFSARALLARSARKRAAAEPDSGA